MSERMDERYFENLEFQLNANDRSRQAKGKFQDVLRRTASVVAISASFYAVDIFNKSIDLFAGNSAYEDTLSVKGNRKSREEKILSVEEKVTTVFDRVEKSVCPDGINVVRTRLGEAGFGVECR